jgi:tetratricopeptide (TPR) repeat protein
LNEGKLLSNIGFIYQKLGQGHKALEFFKEALLINKKVGAPESIWNVWDDLSHYYDKIGQPLAAILEGKQAVNTIQSIRAVNAGLEKDQQLSFLNDKKHVYTGLVDLLIDQGRIHEAEQVMAMLKEEEFFDFIRRDGEDDKRSTQVNHTPAEQQWHKNYQQFSDKLVNLGK